MQADCERSFREKYIDIRRNRWNPHIRYSYPFIAHVIRQENLVADLCTVLSQLGLKAVDILSWSNRTRNKREDYPLYYSDSLVPLALDAFSDEMDVLKYEIPTWCERRHSSD